MFWCYATSLLERGLFMANHNLQNVVMLIDVIPKPAKGTHLLYVNNDSLCLQRRTTSPVGGKLVAKITSIEINHGLTEARWNFIDNQLRKFNE